MKGKTSISKLKSKISDSISINNNATIYLFGSYAKGKQTAQSDVDLLVIADKKDTAKAIVHQLYKKLSDVELDYDILGLTKKALLKQLQESTFYNNIINNGIILYGKQI